MLNSKSSKSLTFACLWIAKHNYAMSTSENRRIKLKEWFSSRSIPAEEKSYISQLISGKASFGEKAARRLESSYGMSPGYLDDKLPNETSKQIGDYTLVSADDTDAEKGSIDYWNVKGSCGGGFLNFDPIPKGQLIKEASFFRKYDTKPEHAFAIYADGDSMADRIGDGDLCIFNSIKTTPVSGQIYLIDHPDGLRIKTLRRMIDGTWILESNNPDKRRFPDEVIPAGHDELLKIRGLFLYRQG